MAKSNITKNIVGYAIGLAGLFVTVYVAGKAWKASN
jgi:hypothetical protein